MAQLKPVDFDPFAPQAGTPKLIPVDDDPFAQPAQPAGVARFAAPPIGAANPAAAPPYDSLGDAAAGAAKAFGSGVLKGAVGLGTLPGNLEVLGRAGVNSLAGMVGIKPPLSPEAINPVTYNSLMERIEGRFGETYKPKTTAERYIGTIGEFAPLGGLNPGSLAAKAAGVVAPAVASEAAGQATEGTRLEPWARVGGALLGGTAANVAARAVTPAPALDPVKRANVATLEKEGVRTLTAGQRTGNQRVRSLEDASLTLPGGGRSQTLQTKSLEEFGTAALKKAGLTPQDVANAGMRWEGRVTDDIVELGFRNLGNEYSKVANVARVVNDKGFSSRLQDVVKQYKKYTPPSQQIGGIEDDVRAVIQKASQPGGMSGKEYLSYVSTFKRIQRGLKNNPEASQAIGRLIENIDLQMIKSAPRNIRPQVHKFMKDLNEKYRNMLAVEKATSRQGEKAAAGLVSPQALKAEIYRQSPKASQRTRRDMAKLASAGDDILRDLKSSGTAERNQAISMLKSPASIASGLAGGALTGDPIMAAMSWAAPLAIQAGTARGITNPVLQRYLANQMLPGRVGTEAARNNARFLAPMMLTRDDTGQQQIDPVALGRLLSSQR